MWILKTEELTAAYVLEMIGLTRSIKAVNQVDFEIMENEVYGLAGESGGGKTSLLQAIYGDYDPPLRPLGGRLCWRVNGESVDFFTLKRQERRKLWWNYISFVSQSAMSVLNPVIKIRESFGHFSGGGRKKEEAMELAERHLIDLGLSPKVLDSFPHQLSGGMRQRVIIALASLLSPRIMLADEPITALDVVMQRGVLQLLKEVQTKLQASLVMVTHDMGVHANIADRIGVVYGGRIIEEALTEKLFGEPLHPYTKYLVDSVPQFGDKARRESAPGSPPSLEDLPDGCPFHPRCLQVKEICRREMPATQIMAEQHRVACWLLM